MAPFSRPDDGNFDDRRFTFFFAAHTILGSLFDFRWDGLWALTALGTLLALLSCVQDTDSRRGRLVIGRKSTKWQMSSCRGSLDELFITRCLCYNLTWTLLLPTNLLYTKFN